MAKKITEKIIQHRKVGMKTRTLIEIGKIKIRPMLSIDKQVRESVIVLRLGNEFIFARRSSLVKLDPADFRTSILSPENESNLYLPFGSPFVLHPRQFVLASTLEFISLPKNIKAEVKNRINWSRLGLILATNPILEEGYSNIVTLELVNWGDAPILLYPGALICELHLFSP